MTIAAALVMAGGLGGCWSPRTSSQRLGVRVVDGKAEILVGLCPGERLDELQVRGSADEESADEKFVDWWAIARQDDQAGTSTPAESEQVITVGVVPEGFEETVPFRGPPPAPPAQFFGTLQTTVANASFNFEGAPRDGDERWYVTEDNELFTTDELLAQRSRVCEEAAPE